MNTISRNLPTSSPRFGTTIKFVPLKVLEDKFPVNDDEFKSPDFSLISHSPWNIKTRVSLQPIGYTDGAHNCNIIAIHNMKRTAVAHLVPKNIIVKKQAIIDELKQDIAALREEGGPLYAIITAGRGFRSPVRKESRELFSVLRKLCESEGISHVSILWGLANGKIAGGTGTGLFCDAKKDEVLIANERIPLTSKGVRESFKVFSIAEGDTFEVVQPKSIPFVLDKIKSWLGRR